MATQDPFRQYGITSLYHFTDRRNATSIRELGGLHSLASLREMGIEIPAPGGNEWSHTEDERRGLDQYVHLCFRRNHPMEFRARQDGRITDSVFLEIDTKVLRIDGVMYTPGVSNKAGVEAIPIEDAHDLIDFEVLISPIKWDDPAFMERLRQAEKCEILVPNHVPMKYIRNLPNG